jgi:undecaprenyl-diphosphatase
MAGAYDDGVRRSLVLAAAASALAPAVALTVAGTGDDPDKLPNWQALVLGLVQGLTELLPISSSGHLIIVPWLFEWEYLEQNDAFNQTFDVSLHLGTLVAVGAYFWPDILRLVGAWLGTLRRRSIRAADERVAWFVAVATVPAALIGALGEDWIAKHLGEPWQIAILLAVFAVVLWWADRREPHRGMGDLTLREAVAVGFAQSLSLMPGVSRSGITISAGRLLGLDRDSAARFSFLLLLPITFGAVVWKGIGDVLLADLPSGMAGPFAVGVLASLASGLVAILFLLGYVRRHDYSVFVVYRLLAAAVVLLLIVSGVRSADF